MEVPTVKLIIGKEKKYGAATSISCRLDGGRSKSELEVDCKKRAGFKFNKSVVLPKD